GGSDAATYWPAESVTTARSMPVATLRTVIDTPGRTAVCGSVTVPWSVAVDCAVARGAPRARTATTSEAIPRARTVYVRLIIHLTMANSYKEGGDYKRSSLRAAAFTTAKKRWVRSSPNF